MESIYKTIKIFTSWFLELLFPSICLGCQKRGEVICSKCLSQINRTEKETNDKVLACFKYRNPLMKKIIWNLKYYHHPYLGQKLGKLLYDELLEDISNLKIYNAGSPIWVIPVPISITKTKKRGYNQAEKIAKGLCSQETKENLVLKNKIVFKKFETISQAKIKDRNRRLKNIHGAFDIKNKTRVRGKTIIIIDDVTTTGGTINEIKRILEKAGARKVVGFTVAH